MAQIEDGWIAPGSCKLISSIFHTLTRLIQAAKHVNRFISKYLFYYPTTLLKGEYIGKYLSEYRDFQYGARSSLEHYQLSHLKRLLDHAYSNSDFYQESFNQDGIRPGDIKSLKDLKLLPFLNKNDLATKNNRLAAIKDSFFVSEKTTGGSTEEAATLLKNAGYLLGYSQQPGGRMNV